MAGIIENEYPDDPKLIVPDRQPYFRLAYVATHPIQYQAPLLRLIAASKEIDLKVFFLSDFSLRAHHEKSFGQTFKWDVPLTKGYAWEVLPRWGAGTSTAMRSWWPMRGMKQKFKQGDFDAVWAHGWGHIGLRQAISTAHSLGVPVLLRGESTLAQKTNHPFRRKIREIFCRRLFKKIAGFLFIGALNREFYRDFGIPGERLFSVPYAVDNDWFQAQAQEAAAKRETFRAELGLELNRPVILFAAKFIPAKAPMDLLGAYQVAWRGSQTKPHLLFVGDGPLRGELEAQAGALKGNDVRFFGFRNQTELPAFFDLCDVFVLPSHFEPWGLVINEVMNAGKPVIVSDRVNAASDLVKPGENGWIYQHGNVNALAECLTEAFSGSNLKAMGARSLEIINRWNFDVDLEGLLAALKSVCQPRNKSPITKKTVVTS